MIPERPDLSQSPATIRAYIEALETELNQYRSQVGLRRREKPRPSQDILEEESISQLPLEPSELPTTLNVITLTASGLAKRTPRHLYSRQRRGGMGIFDLDAPDEDPSAILLVADCAPTLPDSGSPGQSLLLFTDQARAFRLPVAQILEAPVRSRGQLITAKIALFPDEHFVAALPDEARGAVAMVSQRGLVRHLRHHVFGEYMKPGTAMFDPQKFGTLVAACRTPGDSDLFIATRQGKAIRFSEKLVLPQGGPGIKLETGDVPVAITAVEDDSKVFLVDAQGRGTIRLMSGFGANKSAGGGGKTAMNTGELVAALSVTDQDDIFVISGLSKIIRFMAGEVPEKEGVVQGVNCMLLRADEVVAVVASH